MIDKLETCKNCTYWQGNEISKGAGVPFKMTCSEKGQPYVTWECRSPKFIRAYGLPESERPIDGAVLENDEGWGIETGPDFGCIHWQVKEPF